MFCKKCGHSINEDSRFCLYCGEKVAYKVRDAFDENTEEAVEFDMPSYSVEKETPAVIRVVEEDNMYNRAPAKYNPQQNNYNNYNPVPPVQQVPVQQVFIPANNVVPPEYAPLSAWAYFGYKLLFLIPVVGFICLIIFSCSSDNINRRNFARSYWCEYLICFVIFLIALLVTSVIGISLFTIMDYAVVY